MYRLNITTQNDKTKFIWYSPYTEIHPECLAIKSSLSIALEKD